MGTPPDLTGLAVQHITAKWPDICLTTQSEGQIVWLDGPSFCEVTNLLRSAGTPLGGFCFRSPRPNAVDVALGRRLRPETVRTVLIERLLDPEEIADNDDLHEDGVEPFINDVVTFDYLPARGPGPGSTAVELANGLLRERIDDEPMDTEIEHAHAVFAAARKFGLKKLRTTVAALDRR